MPVDPNDIITLGWGERLRESLMGPLIGLVLFFGSIALLYWNEGRAVAEFAALERGARIVQTVAADTINPANDGKLIHLTGTAQVTAPILDRGTGVTAPGLLRLERRVEMYQWQETRNDKTIEYKKEWSSSAIDSSRFRNPDGHANPKMPLHGGNLVNDTATLGAFGLTREVLDDAHPLSAWTPAGGPFQHQFRVADGGLYRGTDPMAPQVGDIRVTYQAVAAGALTVVARQSGNSLAPYQTPDGPEIALARPGSYTAQQMFKFAYDEEVVLTWILRGVGALVMWIGVIVFFKPFSTLLSGIPFVGEIFDAGLALAAFVIVLPLSLTIIALAWVAHRPWLAAALVIVGLATAFGARRLKSAVATRG